MKRSCGILMHISSLPSPYGIGTFGKEAERFADWLKSAGQKYWQVLPIGPTGYADSPYQPFSSFAGNPLLIDLDDLVESGWLAKSSVDDADYGADPTFVDFDKVSRSKMALLREAFAGFTDDVGYTSFVIDEQDWLEDYALFTALKSKFGGRPYTQWDEDIKMRRPDALSRWREELSGEIKFVKFVQYVFWRQWDRFHRYCNKNGIQLIGDIPIYVSPDCADVWAQPELFELNEKHEPKRVAGVPPDYFSKTGQLWGNPLYNWQEMHKTGYKWWLQRIGKAQESFDMLRIDHFRAFDTYYAIPAGELTAEHGTWEKGPGMELFNAVKNDLGDVNIIAEDLGDIFESVKELLRDTGFPGMRVLQFGFNAEHADNDHLPHNYPANCCAYTGTHDNSTIMEWLRDADPRARAMAKSYADQRLFERFNMACVRTVYASPAALAIIPMQDILGLGKEARMNVPSTVGGNWKWRMLPGKLSAAKAEKLRALAETYFR